MHSVSVDYTNTLKRNVALRGKALLLAEWNYNRFAGPATVFTSNHVNADTEEFPQDSIVAPHRPQKSGLLKARLSARTRYASPEQSVEGYVQSKYDDARFEAGRRSYTVDRDSKFKYWSSPTYSNYVISSGIYTLGSDANNIEVTYTKDVWANKVVAVFEASVAVPKNITVSYKTSANGAWTAWAGTFQVDADGRLELFRQADGTLGATPNYTAPTKIRGIKITVAGLSKSAAALNVIEISARLQLDLSDFLIDYDAGASMSEVSMVTPLGQASSNEGSITLDNVDGRFNNEQATIRGTGAENILYGIIDKNVRLRIDFGLEVNGAYEYTRAMTAWADEWSGQGQSKVTISTKDSSKILQEEKPNASLHQNVTTAGAIWRLCDSVGFNDYVIDPAALSDNYVINYYWTDPEKTVWEHLQDIAETTQTAIFFDEYDQLKVLPRNAAYNLTKPVVWTFDGEDVGSTALAQGRLASDNNKLADIIESNQSYDYEANTVNVNYVNTTVSAINKGIPKMEVVWQPEGDVVLRASRLNYTADANTNYIRITPADASVWPYTGVVQVENEFMKYVRKGYNYRNAAGMWVGGWVASAEDKKKLDDQNKTYNSQNYFNGYLDVTGGRGYWGTPKRAHTVGISGWVGRYRTLYGTVRSWNGGLALNNANGTMQLTTNNTFTPNSWYVVSRGSAGDTPPNYFGTRLRMPTSGYGYGAAGIAFDLGSNDSGYFVEVLRTVAINANDRAKYTNELVFYRRDTNGAILRIGPNGGKGIPLEIVAGKWYDLDVKMEIVNGYHTISVALNGVGRMVATVPAGKGLPRSGRYGTFTRGFTKCEFEYFYATTSSESVTFDQPGWWDNVRGGYQSSELFREWIYNLRTGYTIRVRKPTTVYTSRRSALFLDEFAPVVHEIREYEVEFEKKPVIHSNLYISNDRQVVVPEYKGTPFGAKFLLANTARVNAIVNGEDTLTFGSDNPVEQKMVVYGRLVEVADAKKVTVKDDAAVNRRGAVEVDIESSWIQTEAAAKAIGEWIKFHWGNGTDEVTITSVGNPLLQLGDLVAVADPDKSMSYAKNKYFVVDYQHTYDGSLKSTFKLRRAKV